jgi:hypothetical protein
VLPFRASSIVPVRARHLIPLAFVASLIASLALPFPWSIVIASAYLLANLAASVRATLSSRPSNPALLPIAFLTLHLAYGLGSAWGCIVLASHCVTQMARSQFKTCKPH